MMYLLPIGGTLRGMDERLGILTSAAHRGIPSGILEGRKFGVDNGVFTGVFEEMRFLAHLDRLAPYQKNCLFVACPDVMNDACMTLENYDRYAPLIMLRGFKVAYVAQDGSEDLDFPPYYDALFVGGSTEWKMSRAAVDVINTARTAGKWIHVGRVNSWLRFRHFKLCGAKSVDGTKVRYQRSHFLQEVTRWVREI